MHMHACMHATLRKHTPFHLFVLFVLSRPEIIDVMRECDGPHKALIENQYIEDMNDLEEVVYLFFISSSSFSDILFLFPVFLGLFKVQSAD